MILSSTKRRARGGRRAAVALTPLLLASLPASPAAFAQQDADSTPEVPPDTHPPDSVDDRLERLEQENAELRERLDLLAGEIERFELRDVMPEVGASRYGMGPAASKVYAKDQGLSIGGYGEMLFESYAGDGRSDRLDFLRAVLYTGYKFDEHWVFNSELEVEHASTGEGGEVSLEFAYLDYLHREPLNARVGLMLVPMGFLNEQHEPTTYLEVSRPLTERRILPTTWRENGAGVFGDAGDFSYRAYVVNGLDASGFSAADGLRGGRQDGGQALAEDLAVVGRLDWENDAGVLLGGSIYSGDSGQGQDSLGDAATIIYEAHASYRWRGFSLRALAAMAEVDDVATLNSGLGLSGSDSIGDEMRGAYVTLGYDVMPHLDSDSTQSLTPFVRWETIDTQASVPDGFASNPANDEEVVSFGFDYKPIERIVFKLGYEDHDQDVDRFNFLVGYVF